jgi:LuxR family maltose regulon positive regulatory protein
MMVVFPDSPSLETGRDVTMTDGRTRGGHRLLSTKLYVPPAGSSVIRRPRLLRLLDDGARRGISLVSAPAGFGKSTLVADWLGGTAAAPAVGTDADATTDAAPAPAAGWVSLDAADRDPILFWSYVIAACQEVDPAVGLDAGALLAAGPSSGFRDVVLRLLNDLAALDRPLTLVLDDLHLVDSDEIREGVALFAERRPDHLHLVLISRTDAPIPLGRLRGQGRVVDIDRERLRFTPDEAAAFLRDVMALDLAPDAVATLEARTEGWVAGLQLAALSMRHRDDQEAFATSLSGGHRHIARFLAEEVVQQQEPAVSEFLQQVSILRRMCGPVCDALTGGSGGGELLERVARSNLFVIPLDDRGEWYRFHHLFGEFLERRLAERGADEVGGLHARASAWFAAHGLDEEAVYHALRAPDVEGAADLIERSWRALDRRHQSGTWRGWVAALPHSLVQARPVLAMGYAWAHLDAGEIDEGERWLDRTDALLAGPADARVVADAREFASLPGTLAAARAFVAQARGDMEATVAQARRALELLPESDPFYRGIPAVTVGLAQWGAGSLLEAEASFEDAVRSFTAAGNALFVAMALYALGEIQRLQGRVHDAEATLRRAERSPDAGAEPRARVLRGLAEVLLERGEVDEAEHRLDESGRHAPGGRDHRLCLAWADLHDGRGDEAGVRAWLERAEAAFEPGILPESRSVVGRRARWALERGRLDDARAELEAAEAAGGGGALVSAWDRRTRIGVEVARVEAGEVALGEVDGAVRELRKAAAASGRLGDALDADLLALRLAAAGGDESGARARMDDALEAAERMGLFRTFLRHGAPLHPWIRDAALRNPERRLARRLNAAVKAHPAAPAAAPTAAPPAAPLTPREVDVLRLVAAGLTNKEIARQCFISVATVKRHAANIFAKLGVSNRTRAAARADELGLL